MSTTALFFADFVTWALVAWVAYDRNQEARRVHAEVLVARREAATAAMHVTQTLEVASVVRRCAEAMLDDAGFSLPPEYAAARIRLRRALDAFDHFIDIEHGLFHRDNPKRSDGSAERRL